MKWFLVASLIAVIVLAVPVPIYDNDYEECDLCLALMSHLTVPQADFDRVFQRVCTNMKEKLCAKVKANDKYLLRNASLEGSPLYTCVNMIGVCAHEPEGKKCNPDDDDE